MIYIILAPKKYMSQGQIVHVNDEKLVCLVYPGIKCFPMNGFRSDNCNSYAVRSCHSERLK